MPMPCSKKICACVVEEKVRVCYQYKIEINLGFWEAHLPINTYFTLRAKCWLRGGVGGQFLSNLNLSPESKNACYTLETCGQKRNFGRIYIFKLLLVCLENQN